MNKRGVCLTFHCSILLTKKAPAGQTCPGPPFGPLENGCKYFENAISILSLHADAASSGDVALERLGQLVIPFILIVLLGAFMCYSYYSFFCWHAKAFAFTRVFVG